ncbi:MAG: biotin--[Lachnospiraceae bacterium]|nr:biotin--[acetyl-CoA-carboxylase] ligase [Lachnospiraceae bacterium]
MSISTKDKILALLFRAGGNFISGEDAGKSLGISRSAVSTAVKGLRDEGFAIEAVTNRGYRLTKLPDAITAGTLLSGLSPERMENLTCLKVTESTNSSLMELAQKNAPDGRVVISEMQTAGRGRSGKSFASPEGQGIYLSYLIRPDTAAGESAMISDWGFITAAVGRTVSLVLKELYGISPEIKENELLVNKRKLCGILTQTDMEVESGMFRALVAGIGINVHQRDREPDPKLRMTSIDMETSKRSSRPALAAALILALDELRRSLRCHL